MNERNPTLGDKMNIGEVEQENVTGKVKKWFEEKGFGFITADKKDYFVHITKVESKTALEVGETVEFDVLRTIKGTQATNVRQAL